MSSTTNCEYAMLNKLVSENGWDIIDDRRCVAIGNKRNCNDEILSNPIIETEMKSFAIEYNITDYKIIPIVNEVGKFWLFSVSLSSYSKLENHITKSKCTKVESNEQSIEI
uniref:Uncharacterized protein n=1 Tax=viral metagenome TaxID=1070528 RepID=A0A6C0LJM9_9ZZZZ